MTLSAQRSGANASTLPHLHYLNALNVYISPFKFTIGILIPFKYAKLYTLQEFMTNFVYIEYNLAWISNNFFVLLKLFFC